MSMLMSMLLAFLHYAGKAVPFAVSPATVLTRLREVGKGLAHPITLAMKLVIVIVGLYFTVFALAGAGFWIDSFQEYSPSGFWAIGIQGVCGPCDLCVNNGSEPLMQVAACEHGRPDDDYVRKQLEHVFDKEMQEWAKMQARRDDFDRQLANLTKEHPLTDEEKLARTLVRKLNGAAIVANRKDLDKVSQHLDSKQDQMERPQLLLAKSWSKARTNLLYASRMCEAAQYPEALLSYHPKHSMFDKLGAVGTMIASPTHHQAATVGFFIRRKQDNKKYLYVNVAVRGSETDMSNSGVDFFFDWAINLFCLSHTTTAAELAGQAVEEQNDVTSFGVHAGFKSRTKRMWVAIHDEISKMRKIVGEEMPLRIYFVGHSQGAAVATLLGLAARSQYPNTHTEVFAFNPPAIIDVDSPDPFLVPKDKFEKNDASKSETHNPVKDKRDKHDLLQYTRFAATKDIVGTLHHDKIVYFLAFLRHVKHVGVDQGFIELSSEFARADWLFSHTEYSPLIRRLVGKRAQPQFHLLTGRLPKE